MSATRRGREALADRIASALREETPSEEIAALITEAEHARGAAEEAHGAAHARALDPTTGAEAASAAKCDADTLRFEVDRLAAARESLRAAHQDAKAREVDARRRAAYDVAQTERDALVEELRKVYPEIERRLADLIGRVAASDAALDRVNRNLPSARVWLASAEEIARGGQEKFGGRPQYLALRITSLLRLPRFETDANDPYAWPSARF
jgi:chromosome segregation ATPase